MTISTPTPRRVSGRTVALVVIAVGVSGAVLGQLGRYVLGPAPWRMTLTPSPTPSVTPTSLVALVPHDSAADRPGGTPTLGILAITTRDAAVQPYASPTGATATPWPAITLPPPVATARTLERDGEAAAAEATVRALAAGTGPDAVWGAIEVARMLARRDDNAGALAAIELAMAGGGPDALPPPGRLILAETLEAEGRAEEALAAYDSYVRAVPAMAEMVGLERGQLLFVLGRYEEALADFRAAYGANSRLALLREANTLLRLDRADEALGRYRQAMGDSDADLNPQSLAGQIAALLEVGDTKAALARREELVRDYPQHPLAAAALTRLEEAGQSVTPDEEAAVLIGQGDIGGAITLLDAAISSKPDHPLAWDAALARAHEQAGSIDKAVAVLDSAIGDRTDSDSWASASALAWQRAEILRDADRPAEAAEAYAEIAAAWPDQAAAARYSAAVHLQHAGQLAAAAAMFESVMQSENSQPHSAAALWKAGLARWRLGETDAARRNWQSAWDASSFEDIVPAYWLGLAESQRPGRQSEAEKWWRTVIDQSPFGYYASRAITRLGNPSNLGFADPSTTGDPEAIGRWLATWNDANFDWRQAQLAARAHDAVTRSAALLAAGQQRAAASALLNSVSNMTDYRDIPLRAALAQEAERLGLTRAAILIADDLVADDLLDFGVWPHREPTLHRAAPAALLRLAYPDSAYGDLIRAAATQHGVPQDLLFAVVREESRFEPGVGSSAGAVGLTQVMPETGQHLAGQLGLADFAVEDLKKPAVALDLGAYFLGRQIADYDGRLAPALAAYNAGPGNALRWWREAGGDEDLFVEIIDFPETSRYVKNVLASRAMYGRLYPDLR